MRGHKLCASCALSWLKFYPTILAALFGLAVILSSTLYGRSFVAAPPSELFDQQPNTPPAVIESGGESGLDGWRRAVPGYHYSFPRDHSSHPEYRIEWWYYTGNLVTNAGRRFGYQLTFFRIGVVLEPDLKSRWAVRDLHLAHFAISDMGQETFHSFERLNRAGVGWAGAKADSYRVWNEDWEAGLDGEVHRLKATDGGSSIDLRLASAKPDVIHGAGGVSVKGSSGGNASHYYSMTRMKTSGRLRVDGEELDVEGLSWMDHEFGSSVLEKDQIGWDWFSIHLDDGRDLMLFQIRRADGSIDSHSSGTLVGTDGHSAQLAVGDFSLVPVEVWSSADTGANYPVSWRVLALRYGIELTVKAAFNNQELQTKEGAGVSYWEGGINVTGSHTGRGYLEMTGYAGKSMGSILN